MTGSLERGESEDGGPPAMGAPVMLFHVRFDAGGPHLRDDQWLPVGTIADELALDLEVLDRWHEPERRAIDCSIRAYGEHLLQPIECIAVSPVALRAPSRLTLLQY